MVYGVIELLVGSVFAVVETGTYHSVLCLVVKGHAVAVGYCHSSCVFLTVYYSVISFATVTLVCDTITSKPRRAGAVITTIVTAGLAYPVPTTNHHC